MKNPPSAPPPAPWRNPALGLGALLLATHLGLGLGFIRSAGPTYDEAIHLASGYSYLKTGRYRLNIMDHPPLAEMWAALPLLPLSPNLFLAHPDWLGGRLYHYSDLFLYKNNVPAKRLLERARAFNLFTWSTLAAALLFAWAWSAAGPAAAAGAALAHAFSPALLANLSLVTTDGASAVLFLAAFASGAAATRRDDDARPSRGFWTAAGLAVGLAMGAKFNMIALPPLIFALAVAPALLARRPPSRGVWWMLGAAVLALAAVYRFSQLPLWWQGLSATLSRLEEGRSSFFFGRYSVTGFLAYFPVALAIKTPLPTLLLALAGLASLTRQPWRRGVWLWLPAALYFAAALATRVQIGYRHVLPVVPFLLLWAGLGAAWLWERGRAGRGLLAVLAAWLVVSVARAQPHQLAYFNEAAGGPERGYERLVDSNLDWGQAIEQLGEELGRRGRPPIYFAYFGTADPEAYGIRYLPAGFISNVTRLGNETDPSASGRVLLAISATNLQGTYYRDKQAFAWLRARKPVFVAGHSIFLYDLTQDGEGRRALALLLPPEAARPLLAR
ncbi:MAG: hypothetical protein HY554_14615 [Elusimicrobia bacterium]|nr:hypothetical protein [Elusimicrobiota bacterium]